MQVIEEEAGVSGPFGKYYFTWRYLCVVQLDEWNSIRFDSLKQEKPDVYRLDDTESDDAISVSICGFQLDAIKVLNCGFPIGENVIKADLHGLDKTSSQACFLTVSLPFRLHQSRIFLLLLSLFLLWFFIPAIANHPFLSPSLSYTGFFDPLGLSKGKSPAELKKFREAELKHGRVAMLATLGFVVQESFHPLWGFADRPVAPAVYEFQEVEGGYPFLWEALILGIGIIEGKTILKVRLILKVFERFLVDLLAFFQIGRSGD